MRAPNPTTSLSNLAAAGPCRRSGYSECGWYNYVYHRYPEFLELSVMLLETYFRKSLDALFGPESDIETVDECFAIYIESKALLLSGLQSSKRTSLIACPHCANKHP